MKFGPLALLLILSCSMTAETSELAQAKSFIQSLAQNVRFIDIAEKPLKQDRFLEAIYWTADAFQVSEKPIPKFIVIHVEKQLGDFIGAKPYPVAVWTERNQDAPNIYEIWLVGRVTDAMMITALGRAFQSEYNLDEARMFDCEKTAFKHLQSTISVSEEKKP